MPKTPYNPNDMVRISFAVTKDDYAYVKETAKSKGINISGWMRMLIIDDMKRTKQADAKRRYRASQPPPNTGATRSTAQDETNTM